MRIDKRRDLRWPLHRFLLAFACSCGSTATTILSIPMSCQCGHPGDWRGEKNQIHKEVIGVGCQLSLPLSVVRVGQDLKAIDIRPGKT
jgi:hypothetical protein